MPQVGIEQIGQATKGMVGFGQPAQQAGGFWTPQNITQIITGIKDLMTEYNRMRGLMGGDEQQVMDNGAQPIGDMQPPARSQPQPDAITMNQVKDFAQRLIGELERQGYGDKTVLQVLEGFPFTISQIKGMVK